MPGAVGLHVGGTPTTTPSFISSTTLRIVLGLGSSKKPCPQGASGPVGDQQVNAFLQDLINITIGIYTKRYGEQLIYSTNLPEQLLYVRHHSRHWGHGRTIGDKIPDSAHI